MGVRPRKPGQPIPVVHVVWRRAENDLVRLLAKIQRRQIRRSLKSIGRYSEVRETVEIYHPDRCDVGERSRILGHTVIYAEGGVSIGSDVWIAAHCTISSVTHPTDPDERRTGRLLLAPVRIEDGAWLGAGAIILSGVTVGRDAIVGAGSVVTRDVFPGDTVIGVPARSHAPASRIESPAAARH